MDTRPARGIRQRAGVRVYCLLMAHAARRLADALNRHTDQEFTSALTSRDQELLADAITDFFCSEPDETGVYTTH